jgi:hypothetical protein
MGHSEEIERILSEIEENDGDTIPISETFLFIPNNSIIGVQKSKIDYNALKCRQKIPTYWELMISKEIFLLKKIQYYMVV